MRAGNQSGMSIRGVEDIDRTFQRLGDKVSRRLMGRALKSAARPIVKEARSNAERIADTGELARSISSKQRTSSKKGFVDVYIGPFKKGTDAFYAHLVEFGTAPHAITPARGKALKIGPAIIRGVIQHPGSAAKPFLRPALRAQAKAAVRILGQKLKQGIEREARKGARK